MKMNPQTSGRMDELFEQFHNIHRELAGLWLNSIMDSWQLQMALVMMIVLWTVWFKFRKKDATGRLLLSGLFVLVIASWFDFLGVSMGWWRYHMVELPTLPSFLLWDFTYLPITVMLLLQVKPQVNPWLKAVVFGGGVSMIGEPLFTWADYYAPIVWHHYYSFPIYIVIYLGAHAISRTNRFAPL